MDSERMTRQKFLSMADPRIGRLGGWRPSKENRQVKSIEVDKQKSRSPRKENRRDSEDSWTSSEESRKGKNRNKGKRQERKEWQEVWRKAGHSAEIGDEA